jgi:NADPH:quinone reductase-like Zn-dependent oxidoreductase
LVAQLSADHVIDYRAVRFEDHVGNVDVVFDTVGGDTLQRSWGTLRPGGRMITIATEGENAAEARVKDAFFIVEPNHDQLTRIGDLLQAGDPRPVVDVVVPLSQASVAHAGDAPGRLGRGKVGVAIAAWVPDPLVGRQERT